MTKILSDDDAPYSRIASEYYDPALHKTSRNFDETGRQTLQKWAQSLPQHGLALDVGAGRGRCKEFLGIAESRIIQLDSSEEMLRIPERERSLLRVCHVAETLPFFDAQFSIIGAFLCDPFLGLNFLGESHRVLEAEGILIGTTPARNWGTAVRRIRGIDERVTRFVNSKGEHVVLPSTLTSRDSLFQMLSHVGFKADRIAIQELALPKHAQPISQDIEIAAKELGVGVWELPILMAFRAQK